MNAALSWSAALETAAPEHLVPTEADLAEARAYLPSGGAAEHLAFAHRQLLWRARLTRLAAFYARAPCRMAHVHQLTASAVTLGRFCGLSATFAEMGEALMPVKGDGAPRTALWARYEAACREGLPVEIRDERWIEAHMADTAAVRASGLERRFETETAARPEEPLWRLLRQHLEMTLGARLVDHAALAGAVPGETAIAAGLGTGLRRLVRAGWALVGRYAWETARALLCPPREPQRLLLGYRRVALLLLASFLTAWSAAGVYRRGVRARHRGRDGGTADAWPLLAPVLGERVTGVDPRVVRFYENPGRYRVEATVTLDTWAARLLARLATWVLGQGVTECGPAPFPARFRTFRRADDSMHFVRELYCGGALRVFDSDFVVRSRGGRAALLEVFEEAGLEVEMDVSPLPEGGLSIRSRAVRWRGLTLPRLGLEVEFQCRPRPEAPEAVDIEGVLRLRPHAKVLGAIRYRAELGA